MMKPALSITMWVVTVVIGGIGLYLTIKRVWSLEGRIRTLESGRPLFAVSTPAEGTALRLGENVTLQGHVIGPIPEHAELMAAFSQGGSYYVSFRSPQLEALSRWTLYIAGEQLARAGEWRVHILLADEKQKQALIEWTRDAQTGKDDFNSKAELPAGLRPNSTFNYTVATANRGRTGSGKGKQTPAPSPRTPPPPPPGPSPSPAGIGVSSSQPSEVYIDKVRKGEVPGKIDCWLVSVGTHVVRIESAKGERWEKSVNVIEGRKTLITRTAEGVYRHGAVEHWNAEVCR